MNLASIFVVLIVFVSVLLILVIMVQNPKGGGLSSTFGSGPQVAGGVKNTGNFLDKSTWTLASLLLVLILLSNTVVKKSLSPTQKPIEERYENPPEPLNEDTATPTEENSAKEDKTTEEEEGSSE